MGTSADSLLFEDDTKFSAVQPGSSLLTVSVPLGLQFGDNLIDGLGQAGNINITAANSINLDGTPTLPDGSPFFSIFTTIFGDADAGEITIETQNLTVTDGAQIQAATGGSRAGGNINVKAKSIELLGISDEGFLSGISAFGSLAGCSMLKSEQDLSKNKVSKLRLAS